MSVENQYLIITFESNYMALKAEKELKSKDIAIEFIPVPREISSACGVCIKLLDSGQDLTNISYENRWQVTVKSSINSKRKEHIYQQLEEENE